MEDNTDVFARLQRLRVQGALTEAEYVEQKRLIGLAPGLPPGPDEHGPGGHKARRRLSPQIIAFTVVALLICAFLLGKQSILPQLSSGGLSLAADEPGTDQDPFQKLCLLAPFMGIESLDHRVSDLGAAGRAAHRKVVWEKAGDGEIVRFSWRDQLAAENHEMSIELVRTAKAEVLSSCKAAKEGAVASRMVVDGQILSGLPVGIALQQALPTDKESTANSTGVPPSASPPTGAAVAVASPATPSRTPDPSPFNPSEQALIDEWHQLEEQCRGGSGDNPATMAACTKRDAAVERMTAAGVCYGKQGQAEYEYQVHRCVSDSNR